MKRLYPDAGTQPTRDHPLATCDGFVFDVDGVLCRGEELIPRADEAIERLRRGGKKVIFIDTEGVSMERLTQICGEEDFQRASQDILFFQPTDIDQQDEAIKKAKSLCGNTVDVGLIVVDSMTLFYRVNLGNGRAAPIGRIGGPGTDVEGLAIPIGQR